MVEIYGRYPQKSPLEGMACRPSNWWGCRLPRGSYHIIAATWPPIVGEALFFRVQDRMSKRRPTVANGGPRARDFTFLVL